MPCSLKAFSYQLGTVLFIPCCCNHLRMSTQGGHSIRSTENWQPKELFYCQGSMILWYTLQCLRFSCFLKNSWLILSAVAYGNDILSFIIYVRPYYIQERPVRSIIIINIIVIVVVVFIYYYRIIVISSPHCLCVVWLVSNNNSAKKDWYSWLSSLAGTIKTICTL